MPERIIQIIPAPTICAVFRMGDGTLKKLPVVCWALVEHTEEDSGRPYQTVVGMTIGTSQCLIETTDPSAEGTFVSYQWYLQ